MLKKMKKQEGGNETSAPAPKFNLIDVVLSSKSFFPSIEIISLKNKSNYFTFNSPVISDHFSSVFRPPSDCNII